MTYPSTPYFPAICDVNWIEVYGEPCPNPACWSCNYGQYQVIASRYDQTPYWTFDIVGPKTFIVQYRYYDDGRLQVMPLY